MGNFALTRKTILLLITCALICITSASATLQVIVQDGTVLSVDVPETGIIATIGNGNVAKVSLTSLPITAVIDGTGNLLQASGPGKIEHYSSGKIRKIGQVGFEYYSSGKVSKIGKVAFLYNSQGLFKGTNGFDPAVSVTAS